MCGIVLFFNKCQQQICVWAISVKGGGSSPLITPTCAPGCLSVEAAGWLLIWNFYAIQFRCCDTDARGSTFFTPKITW